MSPIKRAIALLTAGAFLLTTLAAPYAEAAGHSVPRSFREGQRRPSDEEQAPSMELPPPPRELKVAMPLDIPPNVGRLVSSYWPDLPSSPDFPLVIHVQDIHGLYEAQRNLSEILRIVASHPGPEDERLHRPLLVAVEGAWTPIKTRWLNIYPDKSIRDRTSDTLLRSGILTGEEYAAIVHDDLDLDIVGIEDETLYKQNRTARDDSKKERGAALSFLNALEDRASRIKDRLYPEALKTWDGIAAGYRDGRIPLADFLSRSRSLWGPGFHADDFPTIALFLSTSKMEESINRAALDGETKQLLDNLQRNGSRDDLNRLALDSMALKNGKMSPTSFYSRLNALAKSLKEQTPVLSRYAENLEGQSKIDPTLLLKETNRLEKELPRALAHGDGTVISLSDTADTITLLRRYFDLKLSPEDWSALNGDGPRTDLQTLEASLSSMEDPSPSEDLRPDAQTLKKASLAARRFYELAVERNDRLTLNALKEARLRNADRLVLVAGGFHTPGITDRLRCLGVSHVVVVPRFNPPAGIAAAPSPAPIGKKTLRDESVLQREPAVAAAAFPPSRTWETRLAPEERLLTTGRRWARATVTRGRTTFRMGIVATPDCKVPILERSVAGDVEKGPTVDFFQGDECVLQRMEESLAGELQNPSPALFSELTELMPDFVSANDSKFRTFLGLPTTPPAPTLEPSKQKTGPPLWKTALSAPVLFSAFSYLLRNVQELPWWSKAVLSLGFTIIAVFAFREAGLFMVFQPSPAPLPTPDETIQLLDQAADARVQGRLADAAAKLRRSERILNIAQTYREAYLGEIYKRLTEGGIPIRDVKALATLLTRDRILRETGGSTPSIPPDDAMIEEERQTGQLIGRLLAGRWVGDVLQETENLRQRLDRLRTWRESTERTPLDTESLLRNLREDLDGEIAQWNSAVNYGPLSKHSEAQTAAQTLFRSLQTEKGRPLPTQPERIRALIDERIGRVSTRLQALEAPARLDDAIRPREELLTFARFHRSVEERNHYLVEALQEWDPDLSLAGKDLRKEIWTASQAALELYSQLHSGGSELRDLSAEAFAHRDEVSPLSEATRIKLSRALKEDPSRPLVIRVEDDPATRKAVALFIARFGLGTGRKFILMDPGPPVSGSKSETGWATIVDLARERGRTTVVVDLNSSSAQRPEFLSAVTSDVRTSGTGAAPVVVMADPSLSDRIVEGEAVRVLDLPPAGSSPVDIRTRAVVQYLTEATQTPDERRAEELVRLAEGILQALQARDDTLALPVYDAIARDIEEGRSTYNGNPTPLSRLIEFTDGRVVGRMMAGVWMRDYQRRVQELTSLRQKWINLRNNLIGDGMSPSDVLSKTTEYAEEEMNTWNNTILSSAHDYLLSPGEKSAAGDYTRIVGNTDARRRIVEAFPQGDKDATLELINSHVHRVERSLRALEYPNTLTGDALSEARDTALASAFFSWPYSRRKMALDNLVQNLRGNDADLNISAIWSAYETSRDLRTSNPAYWGFTHSQTQEKPWPLRSPGTSLRDLSSEEYDPGAPFRPPSMENQNRLAQTLTEAPTGPPVFTLVSPEKASRESAVTFLTAQAEASGWKMLSIDPTSLPRDPAKALACIKETVQLARRMGHTGLVLDLNVLLAWQCEGTASFLTTLLSSFKEGETVPLYFLAGPSAENELAFLQNEAKNKFFDSVAKRISLSLPEDILPKLKDRAENILSRADVSFPPGEGDHLLNGLIRTISTRRIPGDRDVLTWATNVLQRAAADVITAVLAEQRTDLCVRQQDLDQAVEALLPLPTPNLVDKMRALLDKNLSIMAPFRAECEAKLVRVSNARRRASSATDPNLDKDKTYLDNILRAFDKEPNPVPKGLSKLEGLPPEEIERQGKIVINDILRNLSKALNASHQGLWRPKEDIETAVGVFLTQILEEMKKGTSAREAASKGMFLLLSGPAGVGKTTLAAALAAALELPFVPIACAGIEDMKVISGFAETYSNSQPGIIINAFQQSKHLRFLLYADEVDKADPQSPRNGGPVQRELAKAFRGSLEDTYLKGDVDTSGLIIVAGINFRERTSPEVLQCRDAKVIEIPGYTKEEKIMMAGLIFDKARRSLGLPKDMITFEDPQRIIAELVDYFPVPGVRELSVAAFHLTKWGFHKMIAGGTSSAVISVDEVRRVFGPPPDQAAVGARAETGVSRILRLTENGAKLLETQAVYELERGRDASRPVVRDVFGEWAADGVKIAVKVGVHKTKQFGATKGDLEGNLEIGMPESPGLPDTSATSGPTAVAVISAIRRLEIEPDAVVVGAVTENERLLPVTPGTLPNLLLEAAKTGVRTLFLAPSGEGSFQEATLGLRDAFRVNAALIGPVEWEGKAVLSLPKELIAEKDRAFYTDRARWNDFIAWARDNSSLAPGVSPEESGADTDAIPSIHLSGSREALRSWLDALGVLAESVGESLKTLGKGRLTLRPPSDRKVRIEWERIMKAVIPPAGTEKIQEGENWVLQGNVEELRAWYWNLLRLSHVPFYVLTSHLDEVTDQILQHPAVLRMGSLSDNGELTFPETDPSVIEKIIRRARLLGARTFVMPATSSGSLENVLRRVPILRGPVFLLGLGDRELVHLPVRLAKDRIGFHAPRSEVEQWEAFIKSLGNVEREYIDELGMWKKSPDGDWISLSGKKEDINAVLAKMPYITESMSYVMAAGENELTPPEIAAFNDPKTAVTPPVSRHNRTAALVAGAVGAAVFLLIGGILLRNMDFSFLHSLISEVFTYGDGFHAATSGPTYAIVLEQLAAGGFFAGRGAYTLWRRVMMATNLHREGDILPWLKLPEESAKKTRNSHSSEALRIRTAEQFQAIESLMAQIHPETPQSQETRDLVQTAEIHFRQLWNKSSVQAGHLFLHLTKSQSEAVRNAILTEFDPSFVGVLIEAGVEASREQLLADGEQALTERAAECSKLKGEISVALEKVAGESCSTKEVQALLQSGMLLELRMLQPFVTRPQGWTATPENALKELDDLETAMGRMKRQLPERLITARTRFQSLRKAWEKISKGDSKIVKYYLEVLDKDMDGDLAYQHAKMAFLRNPGKYPGETNEQEEMTELQAETEERLISSVFSAHLGRPNIRARMALIDAGKWAARRITEIMRSKGERGEKPLHDFSATAHLSPMPEILLQTFNPVFVTLRQSLMEGLDARGCAISAPSVNLLQALPRALAALSLADADVPAPWKFISPDIEGLSPSADIAYTELLKNLEDLQEIGHCAVFLNVTDFRRKFTGQSKTHMRRLLTLCRTNRIALFPVGLPLDLEYFSEIDEFQSRFPLTSIADQFDSPARQMNVEIAAAGYDNIQLTPDAQTFIQEHKGDPVLFRAVELALARARESEISGDSTNEGAAQTSIVIGHPDIQSAFEEAGIGTAGIANDPEALARKIDNLPAPARARGHELLAAGMSPHTMEAIENILGIPYGRYLADMVHPLEPGKPGTPLQQALSRFTAAMEKQGIHDPKLLEAFTLQVAGWIVMEALREKFMEEKRAVDARITGNPRDEDALKESESLDRQILDLQRNITYPLLVGPSEQTKEIALGFIRACLETASVDPETFKDPQRLENDRAFVLDLSGKADVAQYINGFSHTYIGSKVGLFLQRAFRTGVMNPYGAIFDVDLAGQGIKDLLLAILDPEQNRTFHDNKLGFSVDVSPYRLVLTATSTKRLPNGTRPLSEPFLSRVVPLYVTEPSENEIIRRAVEHTLPALRKRYPRVTIDEPHKTIERLLNGGYTARVDPQELDHALGKLLDAGTKKYLDSAGVGPAVIGPADVPHLLGDPIAAAATMKGPYNVGAINFLTIRAGRGEAFALEANIRDGHSATAHLSLGGITGIPKSTGLIQQNVDRALAIARRQASQWGVDPEELMGKIVDVNFHGLESSEEIEIDGDSLGVAAFLAFLSLFIGIPLRPEVTGTGVLDTMGKVWPIEELEKKIITAQKTRRTTFFLPEANRRNLEQALQSFDFPQGLFLRASPDGPVGQLFLPDREPRPGTYPSDVKRIADWNTYKSGLETAANQDGLTSEKTPYGTVIQGTPRRIQEFAKSRDFPLPMTYLIVGRAEDALAFREFLFPPASSPAPAPSQTQTPASRAVIFVGLGLTIVATATLGAAGLLVGLFFARRVWYALLARSWRRLTATGQAGALAAIQSLPAVSARFDKVSVMDTFDTASGTMGLIASATNFLHPLVEEDEGEKTLRVHPGVLWALSKENRWNIFARASAMNALLHELQVHGDNEALGMKAEFGLGKALRPLLSSVPWWIRPWVFLARYVIALSNLPEMLAHKLGFLKGVHRTEARPEELKNRPLAIPFRIALDNRGADANRTNVLTFREDKLSDPAALVELKALERGRPMACVVTDEASARAKLEIVLGKIRAAEIHLIPQTAVSAGNRIDEDAVEKAVAQRMNGAAVRLKILEDAAHRDLWIGGALEILLTPLQESVEILNNAAGEAVLQRLFAGQDEALRRALDELHSKGRFTLPPGNILPTLNGIGGNQIYLIQA